MNIITKQALTIVKRGWFTRREAFSWVEGSVPAMDGLLKRAMASGEILRVGRGLYCLEKRFLKSKLNPLVFASLIYGPSYLSMECALSYWGWIPEAVYTFTSASTLRSKDFRSPFGLFSYRRVPQRCFFAGVERIESEAGGSFLMASPLKALADYVYLNKMPWSSAKPLRESLRVEEETLDSLSEEDFAGISNCYQSGVARRFLSGLQKDLLG